MRFTFAKKQPFLALLGAPPVLTTTSLYTESIVKSLEVHRFYTSGIIAVSNGFSE
jgi:hypothetical protein